MVTPIAILPKEHHNIIIRPPDPDTVDLMETMVRSYLQDLALRAKAVSEVTRKFDKECFVYLVRKDTRKFRRVSDLLQANEEIKSIQKNKLPDENSI